MLGDHDRRTTLRGVVGVLLAAAGVSGTAIGRTEDERTQPSSASSQGQGQGSCDRLVPDDYDTIQDAVDDADEGDAVCVGPGTYEEAVTIDVENVTLQSTNSREATIDASGEGTGVTIDASGVALIGFEIAGDDGTTSGVSIRTSNGATDDITIADNHIHGMAEPGGGGVFEISSWGILAWGDQPLSGVTIQDNLIESIGGSPDELPAGAGIDLEEVEGSQPREGAVIRRNTITDISDATVGILGEGVDLPGVGVSIQPTEGENSGAGDPATDVRRNEITETSIDVVLGETGMTRVLSNE